MKTFSSAMPSSSKNLASTLYTIKKSCYNIIKTQKKYTLHLKIKSSNTYVKNYCYGWWWNFSYSGPFRQEYKKLSLISAAYRQQWFPSCTILLKRSNSGTRRSRLNIKAHLNRFSDRNRTGVSSECSKWRKASAHMHSDLTVTWPNTLYLTTDGLVFKLLPKKQPC